LRDRQNADGGWGTASGESSNVEATALVMLALVGTGETHVVTARLARHALADAKQLLREVEGDRDALRQDFQQRVADHWGQIAAQRQQLLSENSILKRQLENIGRTVRPGVQAPQSPTGPLLPSAPVRDVRPRAIAAVVAAVGVGALAYGVVIGRFTSEAA